MFHLQIKRIASTGTASESTSRSEKNIVIQVVLLGSIQLVDSILYCFFQYVPSTFTSTLTAAFLYILSQGVPSLVYLTFNRTIRRQMFAFTSSLSVKSSHITQPSNTHNAH